MGLKNTRKIISVILTILITFSSAAMLAAFVLSSTFASQKFITKNLVNDQVVAECEAQLNSKFEALETKSQIPARVFEMVEKDFTTASSLQLAVSNLFGAESSTMYSQDKIDYFYKLCTEYLDGNNIKYKKDNIRNVAAEAAKIYSDCVGIHNLDTVYDYLPLFSKDCAKTGSASLLICILCLILLTIMYNEKTSAYIYFCSGLNAGGIGVFISSLLCILTKISSKFIFSPDIYQQSISAMANKYFIYLSLSGLLICVLGNMSLFIIRKKMNTKQEQIQTRFSKIIGKI